MELTTIEGGCLNKFQEVLVDLNTDKPSSSSAASLHSLLGNLSKFLSTQIESKVEAKKDHITAKLEATKKLEAHQVSLNDCINKEQVAAKNVEDTRNAMASRESEIRSAESELESRRRELRSKKNRRKEFAIGGAVLTVLSAGIGSGAAAAAGGAAIAAVAGTQAAVDHAARKLDNARQVHRDAVSAHETAKSEHSAAVHRKTEAQAQVQAAKEAQDKLVEEEALLQVELDCLTDFLQRLSQAVLEVNRTWKMSETLQSTLERGDQLPVSHQEIKSVVSLCGEILAKFRVLSQMQALIIPDEDLIATEQSFARLSDKANQLKIQYQEARNWLTDFA